MTTLQLFRRVQRFCFQILSFPHVTRKMKVNHAFEAKKEAFRERNPRKVKNDPILPENASS